MTFTMRSNLQSLSPKELKAHESHRDLGAELLQAVCEMKAGQVQAVAAPLFKCDKTSDRRNASS